MTILVGGFSPQEYKAYLNPVPKQKQRSKFHRLIRWPLICCSTLSVLIKRIIYLIRHFGAIYPNNANLFNRFRSHDFKTIDSQEAYQIVQKIFARFQRCLDLQAEELGQVANQLREVEKLLSVPHVVIPIDEGMQEESEESAELSGTQQTNALGANSLEGDEEVTDEEVTYEEVTDVEVFDQQDKKKEESLEELEESDFQLVTPPIREEPSTSGENGKVKDGWGRYLWNRTLGLALNETTEAKYLRWKIERYEDLIKGMQKTIKTYIGLQTDLKGIKHLMQQAEAANAPQWIKHLQPLLKFCAKDICADQERLNPAYLDAVRRTYTEEMLLNLRRAASWAKAINPNLPGVQHIDAICYEFYTAINLNECCQKVLQTFCQLGRTTLINQEAEHSSSPDDSSDLIEDLHLAYQQICAVPNEAKAPRLKQWANSLRGHLNGFWGVTTFDPNMQSNPVHVFFNKIWKKKGKKDPFLITKDIAMGSPTIENGSGNVEIAPEFEAFLRHCRRIGHTHLYINNQDFTSRTMMKGKEYRRCKALHDLAEREDVKGTLFVMTLSQNSAFYHQRVEANEKKLFMDAAVFKKEFLIQMFDPSCQTTGNCISKDLIEKFKLKEWSKQAIKTIHEIMFQGHGQLSVEQRRIFIRLFYQNLARKVLFETGAKSYNSSCKDRIDRGAATDAEDFAYLAILADCFNESHVIQFFKMLVFSRAIIVRKRGIIKERLERLIETVQYMIKYQPKLKQLQDNLFPEIDLTIDQFHSKNLTQAHG